MDIYNNNGIRIQDLQETNNIASNDYLVVEKYGQGTRKVKGAVLDENISIVQQNLNAVKENLEESIITINNTMLYYKVVEDEVLPPCASNER